MDYKTKQIITEISNRWKSIPQNVCKDCMQSAVRHYCRNMDHECEDHECGGFVPHPNKYDGTTFAHAGGDIHTLLAIVTDLTKNNQEENKVDEKYFYDYESII